LLLIIFFWNCDNKKDKTEKSEFNSKYTTRSYVTVGKMFDTIQPPYIINISEGKKQLVFIGCDHNTDTTHAQFKSIDSLFKKLKPQIAFNEGGQIRDSIHFKSINDAIQKDGETGVLKFLCDNANIKMFNGDMKDSAEFTVTTAKHPKEEMYLYYAIERIAVPYKYGSYGTDSFEIVYNRLAPIYFSNFPLSKSEKSFDAFKNSYKKQLNADFNIADFDIEAFDYINDNCKFCAIGRTSKEVRDSVLLSKIETAFIDKDRIIVTFGHGHALALEPALTEMMKKFIMQ
jgi:hypothetical protein